MHRRIGRDDSLLRGEPTKRLSVKPVLCGLLALIFANILSFSAHAAQATKSDKIDLKPPPANALPLRTGDLYALVVGVSKYRDAKIPRLGFSDKDAKAFGDFLKGQNGIFKEIHVTSLVDEKATKSEVEKYLYYSLPKAGKNDTIILFFSGHGAFDPIRPTEFLFLPYDAETKYLSTSAVKMSGLDFLKGVNAERVLVISDACYAGGFSEMKPKSIAPSVDLFLREFRNSSGRAIITSSGPEQISWEIPQLKNSVFTHYFLEGLKGKADKDHDGIVTLNEAYEYAYSRTKDETGGRQHPQLEGKMVGAFPLSFVGPRIPQAQLKKKILEAAASGDIGQLGQFLASGADVNARDEENNTPLIVSSRAGHVDIVQLLMAKGADREATNNSQSTALLCAAGPGHAEVVKLLLASGAKVDAKNNDGYTALTAASVGGHPGVVRLLLDHNADIRARTNAGDTALTLACSQGNIEIAKLLLDRGADVNSRGLDGDTPITCASRSGHRDIVKLLLARGARIATKGGGYLENELMRAVLQGDTKRVSFPITKGTNTEAVTDAGDTPLILAAYLGQAEVAKSLLAHGALANFQTCRGTTALMAAAKTGHTDMVNLLTGAGADVNVEDQKGDTALILAARKGYPDVIKLLLSKRASINAENKNGITALVAAVNANRADIVKALIASGADVNAKDKEGNTALMSAAAKGNLDALYLLTSKGTNVNAANNRGSTALILAAKNGHKRVVKFLLAKGVDVRARDWEGKSALTLASERGRQDLVELMKAR